MYVKKYIKYQFKFENYDYYSINKEFHSHMSCILLFLHDGYRYAQREGVSFFLNRLFKADGEGEMRFESIILTVDKDLDLVYLHEDYWDFIKTITDSKLQSFYEDLSDIELCREKIMDCAVMSKKNFIHLLTAWDKLWDQKPPFILLYQDDNDWYDVVPFELQVEIEQFVKNYTQFSS